MTSHLDDLFLEKINPDDVALIYKEFPNMPASHDFSIREAISQIVVSAYEISTMDFGLLTDDNSVCYFVIENCLNSVLFALNESTEAIIGESDIVRKENMQIFLILLISATCSLFFSLLFLIPVIHKVQVNK